MKRYAFLIVTVFLMSLMASLPENSFGVHHSDSDQKNSILSSSTNSPWQTQTQNQLPPINLSAIPDGALAWEWVEQFGRTSDGIEISDVTVDHNGSIYAVGKSEGELQGNFSLGNCEFPQETPVWLQRKACNTQQGYLQGLLLHLLKTRFL